jgi:5-methylcytosine-specific restriction endonuclease McrA
MQVKVCSSCHQAKPATTEFFHVRKASADGLAYVCKTCRRDQERRRFEEKGDEIRAKERARYAIGGKERQRRWQKKNEAHCLVYRKQYRAAHRSEHAAQMRHWREANPDEYRAAKDRYAQRHPDMLRASWRRRRCRKRNAPGSHTGHDVVAQHKRQRGRCYWCQTKVGAEYHVDHVTPLVLGGSNGPENLVIACARCNLSKQARSPMDFAGRLL